MIHFAPDFDWPRLRVNLPGFPLIWQVRDVATLGTVSVSLSAVSLDSVNVAIRRDMAQFKLWNLLQISFRYDRAHYL